MSGAIGALPIGRAGPRHQTAVGLALAGAILAAWLSVHVVGLLLVPSRWPDVLLGLPLMAIATWLDVGLFIVAHDAMHGSLAPFRPSLNRWAGRVALALYAGFSFDRLLPKHHAHHRHAGTADDPDFDTDHPDRFWPWYGRFMWGYMGWREATTVPLILLGLVVLGVHPVNAVLFWGVPALLSSVQLFYFGTYRPHRHEEDSFADRHRARSSPYGWWLSLLTCFHFGYHHEHHDSPATPWWRLPAVRAGR